jgi:hypothetical protein
LRKLQVPHYLLFRRVFPVCPWTASRPAVEVQEVAA